MTPILRTCALAFSLGLIPATLPAEDSLWVKEKEVKTTKDGEVTKKKVSSKEHKHKKKGHRQHKKDVTIVNEDGKVIHRDRDHVVHVDRNNEDGTVAWIRRTEVKESTGRSKVVEAEGESFLDDEGVRHFSIDRDGERVTKKGDVKNWHEDVEGTREKNDIGGRDTEAETIRTKDDGTQVTEDLQRRTRAKDNKKAYIEQKVITDKDGNQKLVQKEGKTIRRYQKHGFSDFTHSQGLSKKGVKWSRQERVDVRYNDDGSRTRTEASVLTSPGKKPKVIIKKGTFTPQGKGWDYVGIVEVREGSKVLEERDVTEKIRRLPFPTQQPLAD